MRNKSPLRRLRNFIRDIYELSEKRSKQKPSVKTRLELLKKIGCKTIHFISFTATKEKVFGVR